MRMTHIDQVCFPKFAQYVKCSLPKVIEVKAIVQAFQKYGQIDRASLKRALQWGSGPDINVTDLDGAYGEFTPDSGSNEIRIDIDAVKEFEAGGGIGHTKSGKPVYIVGVTLLHELIHWADDQDGIDYAGEEGELYETEVYGQVVG